MSKRERAWMRYGGLVLLMIAALVILWFLPEWCAALLGLWQ